MIQGHTTRCIKKFCFLGRFDDSVVLVQEQLLSTEIACFLIISLWQTKTFCSETASPMSMAKMTMKKRPFRRRFAHSESPPRALTPPPERSTFAPAARSGCPPAAAAVAAVVVAERSPPAASSSWQPARPTSA